MHALWLMIALLCVFALAYRFYAKFIASRVLTLNDQRPTPATRLNDNQNFRPTGKWRLFGHHFAAISGASPLIAPLIALQLGYAPGILWILVGVVFGGAVQDLIILTLSARRGGRSLAHIIYEELGGAAGTAATIAILLVLLLTMAGFGKILVKALGAQLITYSPGTRLVASRTDNVGITELDRSGYSVTYSVPADTMINYPDGAWDKFHHTVQIEARWRDLDTATGPVDLAPSIAQHGRQLVVTADVVVTRRVAGSSWGVFSLLLTIPIALLVGLYMLIRKRRALEAIILGALLSAGAIYLGSSLADPASLLYAFQGIFDWNAPQLTAALAGYAFVASLLPVGVMLIPRDYISAFLKIFALAVLILALCIVNPTLHAPALVPGLAAPSHIFPFLLIVLLCSSVSGFNSLVASATTPKMLSRETDAPAIGYGAMLIEGLLAIVVLITAAALPPASLAAAQPAAQPTAQPAALPNAAFLPAVEQQTALSLTARSGPAPALAAGMATLLDHAAQRTLGWTGSLEAVGTRLETFSPLFFQFALLFEALFILSTLDAGTRAGRYMLQEALGHVSRRAGPLTYRPAAYFSSALIVAAWTAILFLTPITAIWPIFGTANALLAVIALSLASAVLVKEKRQRYVWVTALPAACLAVVSFAAAAFLIVERSRGLLDASLTGMPAIIALIGVGVLLLLVVCTITVIASALSNIWNATHPPAPIHPNSRLPSPSLPRS